LVRALKRLTKIQFLELKMFKVKELGMQLIAFMEILKAQEN